MPEMTTEMRRFLQMHQRHFLPFSPIFENFGFGGRQGPMGEEMQTFTGKPTGKPEVRATQTSPPKEVEESTMKSDSSTKMSEESEMMARVNPIQMPTEEQEEERPEENPMQMPMEEQEGERPEENPMQMPTEGDEERPEGNPMQMPMEEQDEERPEGNPMQMPIEEQEEERPEGNPMMEQAMIAQMEREQQPQSDLQEREETMDGFPRDEGRPRMEQNHEFLFSMPPQFGSSMIRLGDYINTGKPREQHEEKEQPEGVEGLREGEEPRNYERPPMRQNGDFLFSFPHYGMPMYRSQERPEDDESNVVEGGAELWLGNRPRHEQMPQIW